MSRSQTWCGELFSAIVVGALYWARSCGWDWLSRTLPMRKIQIGRRFKQCWPRVPGTSHRPRQWLPKLTAQRKIQARQSVRCRFKTGADNPHCSSTEFAVSAHGWWNETSRPKGQCLEFADVEARLQVAWCNDFTRCRWITLDKQERRVREGGGRGRHTTVRFDCASSRVVEYRNVVDVDLVGMLDLPNRVIREQDVQGYPRI